MRTPKPWYWKARKAWYVEVGGKQIRLHEDEKQAHAEFYRIMAANGKLDKQQAARATVADACEALIAASAHCKPVTIRRYRESLGPFAAHFRSRRLGQVTPEECVKFVAGYRGTGYRNRGFGDSSRSLMFRFIKLLFRWAKETGLIDTNPLALVKNPWRISARQRPMAEGEYRAVMADRRINARFKEVLEVMWRTGARPNEVCKLAARHLDPKLPIARLQPTEHKTGTRTGLLREVFFPPDLMARMREYAATRPKGPLLLNTKGRPWRTKVISEGFCRAKKRLKLPADCVIYLARHGFVTRLADSGVPLGRVARLAGHSNTDTIMKHYYHPDTLEMLADVAKLDGGAVDQGGAPASSADTSPGA